MTTKRLERNVIYAQARVAPEREIYLYRLFLCLNIIMTVGYMK